MVLNKIDVPEARELAEFVRDEIIAARGWPVFSVSTVTREGLQPLIFGLWQMIETYNATRPESVPRRPVIRPVPVDESGFTVESDGESGFVVTGVRPQRWVGQTNFDNAEAVGYLADRLARLGVEDELVRLGAQPGCAVTIGDMTFDWEPQTPPDSRSSCRDVAPMRDWSAATASEPPNVRWPGVGAANTNTVTTLVTAPAMRRSGARDRVGDDAERSDEEERRS